MHGKSVFTSLSLLLIFGCTPFLGTHQQFINSMDTSIKNNATIDMLADEKYSGYMPANKDYLIKTENIDSKTDKYYYRRMNTRKKYCHYYFVVDIKTKKAIGWGFTFKDIKKNNECFISG